MASRVSREFRVQMEGYGLTTAEIHYHLPDHPSLLQLCGAGCILAGLVSVATRRRVQGPSS